MPFPILALPRELRDMIYVDAFHPPTRGYITPYTSSYSSSSSSSLSRPSADDFLPPVALLRTSRQVNAEAKGVLEQWRRAVVERKKREWTFAVNGMFFCWFFSLMMVVVRGWGANFEADC